MVPSHRLRSRRTPSSEKLRPTALGIALTLALVLPTLGCGQEVGADSTPAVPAQMTSALTGQTNLARGKPATQSTTAFGALASRAVDGNTNSDWNGGSVTHTDTTLQPWWQVDLESAQSIGTVLLYNRTDCCSERLSDFRLRVSTDGQSWQNFSFPVTAGPKVSFAVNATARYIKVQLNGTNALSLAEVEVYPPNLALGKPATQSTTALGALASRAVDGNTNSDWNGGSVTHTEMTPQPWWQVDLQSAQSIGTVLLYNRTDCCSERLSNFRLRVSTDGQSWQDFPFPGTAGPKVSFAVNQTARYVRVELNGTNPLSLAEVEVYTPVNSQPPVPIIQVDTAGCSTNVGINNAISQSLRVNSTTSLERIDFWIVPNLYYTTSYAVELYDGEGTGGTRLASTPVLTLGSHEAGTPFTWYSFTFQGQSITLQPSHPYTFKLVQLSTYSGGFSECGNVYADGMEYWLGYSSDRAHDVSFRLYGTAGTPPPPPPPSAPLITVDTAGW